MALAAKVIASHYAEPQHRLIGKSTPLRTSPSNDAPVIRELSGGEPFALLDEAVGWAWGYAGEEGRVGYLDSEALATR